MTTTPPPVELPEEPATIFSTFNACMFKDKCRDNYTQIEQLQRRCAELEAALRSIRSRLNHGESCTDHIECRQANAALKEQP